MGRPDTNYGRGLRHELHEFRAGLGGASQANGTKLEPLVLTSVPSESSESSNLKKGWGVCCLTKKVYLTMAKIKIANEIKVLVIYDSLLLGQFWCK